MNKRYIDFVPSKNRPTPRVAGPAVRVAKPASATRSAVVKPMKAARPVSANARIGGTTRVVRKPVARKVAKPVTVQKVAPAGLATGGMMMKAAPALGVVEDLNTHFVKTDVPKRPLSEKHEVSAAAAKAKKVKARGALKEVKRPAAAEIDL